METQVEKFSEIEVKITEITPEQIIPETRNVKIIPLSDFNNQLNTAKTELARLISSRDYDIDLFTNGTLKQHKTGIETKEKEIANLEQIISKATEVGVKEEVVEIIEEVNEPIIEVVTEEITP